MIVTPCKSCCRNKWTSGCSARATETHCTTLQHGAAHCNTHTCTSGCSASAPATYCNTLQHTNMHLRLLSMGPSNALQQTAKDCNMLQQTATHCNTLQHTAAHCSTLQHTAAHCSTLQHTAAHYITLQHTATHCNTHTRTSGCSAGSIVAANKGSNMLPKKSATVLRSGTVFLWMW